MNMPEIEFHSTTSSSYYIALEAWRRGLSVTFIKNSNNYRITSRKKALFFCNSAMISGSSGIRTHHVCTNKFLTKELLLKNNVSVPAGKIVTNQHTDEEMTSYALELGFPIVIKPNDGSHGRDVYANIGSKSELLRVIELFRKKRETFDLIIEEYKKGLDNRVYVVGNNVVAAYRRTPAHVMGDGVHTIKELIELKNEKRGLNPHLKSRPVVLDEEVAWQAEKVGLTLDSVLKKEQIVYLRSKANLSSGGDMEDVTETLPAHIVDLAIQACHSIPTLSNAGIDILFCEKENPEGTVLEINSMAQLSGHIYPSKGKSRPVASAIIDYYFPESRRYAKRNADIYFNMVPIEQYLNAYPQVEFTVAPAPHHSITKKQLIFHHTDISNKVPLKIRDEARRLHINGFLKVNDQMLTVVMAGEDTALNLFTEWCRITCGAENNSNETSKRYDLAITQGFYIVS